MLLWNYIFIFKFTLSFEYMWGLHMLAFALALLIQQRGAVQVGGDQLSNSTNLLLLAIFAYISKVFAHFQALH